MSGKPNSHKRRRAAPTDATATASAKAASGSTLEIAAVAGGMSLQSTEYLVGGQIAYTPPPQAAPQAGEDGAEEALSNPPPARCVCSSPAPNFCGREARALTALTNRLTVVATDDSAPGPRQTPHADVLARLHKSWLLAATPLPPWSRDLKQ